MIKQNIEKIEEPFGLEKLAQITPFFGTKIGNWMGKLLFKVLKVDQVNEVHSKIVGLPASEAAGKLLELLGIKVQVENFERLSRFKEEGFITVSNHPYGSIDGIALVELMGRVRNDFKVMVNDILMHLYALSPAFIGVKPQIGFKKEQKLSTLGLKETLSHLKERHPLCLFPAGAVSLYGKRGFVADREWQMSAVRLVQIAKVPVIPIFFHGLNSPYFYNMEKIHVAIRSLLLPRQIFNKRGYTLRISIGEPITIAEQRQCKDLDELSSLLRNRTYQLSGDERLYMK